MKLVKLISGSLLALALSSSLFSACKKDAPAAPVVPSSSLVDLSSAGTANCYIVSAAGDYSFDAVKGNSSTSVGNMASVEVLWESFGTNDAPNVGDIVKDVRYAEGKIFFSTPSGLKNGNALIAAKDADGTILWSWHLWVCGSFDPALTAHTYKNNAGVMMDRNLGATTDQVATAGSWGLLYQWGRKDPFMGAYEVKNGSRAQSTLSSWGQVDTNEEYGTIEYAVQHPTTFITSKNNPNNDWYYTGDETTDNQRWKKEKTIYDPCPYGWRVPNGGFQSIWAAALGTHAAVSRDYDTDKCAMNLGTDFIGTGNDWYGNTGRIVAATGAGLSLINNGFYWSCTPTQFRTAYCMTIYPPTTSQCDPSGIGDRADAYAVRCQKE